jgi:hypothetical protein
MVNMKAVQESIPVLYTGLYGSTTNAFLAGGCALVVIIGAITLPSDEDLYLEDKWWRFSYAFPIFLVVFQAIFCLAIFKWEPIDYLIKKQTKEADADAEKLVALLYSVPKGSTKDPKEVFANYVVLRRDELIADEASQKKISFKEAVFGEKNWRSTWLCFGLGIVNQVSAIGPV